MRAVAGLFACALLAAGACRAQTAGDDARCEAVLGRLKPYLSPEPEPALATAGPDSCAFKGAQVRLGPYAFAVGTMTVHGVGEAPAGTAAHGPLLHRVVELQDVVQLTRTADAEGAWVPPAHQAPLKVVLDTTEDRVAHTLTVNQLSIEGDEVGRVSLDAVFEKVGMGEVLAGVPGDAPATAPAAGTGVAAVPAAAAAAVTPQGAASATPAVQPSTAVAAAPSPAVAAVPDLSGAGLRSLHLRVDSKQFAATFLLPGLLSAWRSDDPAHAVPALRLQASDMTRDCLHMTHTAPGTADALLAFIRDLPQPAHVLDVSVTVKGDPVTADDVDGATGSMMGMAELLTSLHVQATYAGDAH